MAGIRELFTPALPSVMAIEPPNRAAQWLGAWRD
jgi:hypothetical protein